MYANNVTNGTHKESKKNKNKNKTKERDNKIIQCS